VRNFVWLLLSLSKDGVMEAQIIGGLGHQRIECRITGEAEAIDRSIVPGCRTRQRLKSGR